jgi:hypothetical protein
MHDPFPAGRRIGDLEHCGGIGDVDADLDLFGARQAVALQQSQRQRATPGRVDDEIGAQRRTVAFRVFAADGRDRGPVGRGDDFGHAAACTKCDVLQPLETSPGDEFEQRTGYAENVEAQIASREWIEARRLPPDVETGAGFHRARHFKIFGETRKQPR